MEIRNQSTSGGNSAGKQPEVHCCTHPQSSFCENHSSWNSQNLEKDVGTLIDMQRTG